jgi:hypothetical protein
MTVQEPMQNPAQPFRNLASWARCLEREPELKDYHVEMSIMAKKLDHAHEVFFSLGEMMTIWRSSGLLETHPEFLGAYERAQLAYRTARGEPETIITP